MTHSAAADAVSLTRAEPRAPGPVATTKPEKKRYVMLDGLHGWAALVVVHGHFFSHYGVFEHPRFRALLDTTLAVGVFFVLSGFALAIGYIDRPFRYSHCAANTISRQVLLALPILAVALGVRLLGRLSFTLYLMHVLTYCSSSSAVLLVALRNAGMNWTLMQLTAGVASISTVFLVANAFYPAERLAMKANCRLKTFLQSATTHG